MSIYRQMGFRYLAYRAFYEVCKKSGLFLLTYPVRVPQKKIISLSKWRIEAKPFFFDDMEKISYNEKTKEKLRVALSLMKRGCFPFFSGVWIELGTEYNWMINPENGYMFKKKNHWSKVNEFGKNQGDIKYVWEKARFSFLYMIMRHDLANLDDNSDFVWGQILSWINNNIYNCGPHFTCSQEISIRTLNWIYALYFYRRKKTLTEDIFCDIINSIYWQTKHVFKNRLYSAIAVRNNHAITEALCLFTVGLLFPWFPESKKWLKTGMELIIQEGLYQIYADGSYIQHSFNYQRVVIQLYSWAFALARVNGLSFPSELIERLKKAINFIDWFIDPENGYVPNWGANDSALFFPFNNCDLRDFRPQINALQKILTGNYLYYDKEMTEDSCWFINRHDNTCGSDAHNDLNGCRSFDIGGYYAFRTGNSKTFIRCTRFRNRPFHADNLHVDIWYDHKNIIRDAGTFKYNADPDQLRFFCGTAGHNTIMIDGKDQMEKGDRFIWYKWSEAVSAAVIDENTKFYRFEGCIRAFRHLNEKVFHTRIIRIHKKVPFWIIQDRISGANGHNFSQLWNISDDFLENGFSIKALAHGTELNAEERNSWYSECYSQKVTSRQIVFHFKDPIITTYVYHSAIQKEIRSYMK